MLNGFNPGSDEKKRQLYVAMTRAKRNLSIHLNGHYLDDISNIDMKTRVDNNSYEDPSLVILHLTHKDIWLNYFIHKQNIISKLKSGDTLAVTNEGCNNSNGICVVKFSSNFKENLAAFGKKGYRLKSASVNYIVYWKNEDSDKEIKIILPEIRLQRE